jgi:hypothetical protein
MNWNRTQRSGLVDYVLVDLTPGTSLSENSSISPASLIDNQLSLSSAPPVYLGYPYPFIHVSVTPQNIPVDSQYR